MNPAPARRVHRVRVAGQRREAARWLWLIARCLLRSTWAAVSARAPVQRPVRRHGARPPPPAECGAAYRSHRSCLAPRCRARLRERLLVERSLAERWAASRSARWVLEPATPTALAPSVLQRARRLAAARLAAARSAAQGSVLAWVPVARAAVAHWVARRLALRAPVQVAAALAPESPTCEAPRSPEPAARPPACALLALPADSAAPGRVWVLARGRVGVPGLLRRARRRNWLATTRPNPRATPARSNEACRRAEPSADRACHPIACGRRSRANESAHLLPDRPKRAPENRLLDYARNCHRQRTNPRSLLRSAARGAQREAASV